MPVYPFTPQGVQQKVTTLYALPDAQLLAEAQAAAANFASWLTSNFSLSQDQSTYLNGVPLNIRTHWGYLTGAAIIGRRPITMGALPDKPSRTKETVFTGIDPLTSEYTPGQNGQPPVINFGGDLQIKFQVP